MSKLSFVHQRASLLASLLPLAPLVTLNAQARRDSATCVATLSAPTPDSAVMRVGLRVQPFDTVDVRMTAAYRELIATSVRRLFQTPQPLALRTYGQHVTLAGKRSSPTFEALTLHATYRATLHRDGHLSAIRVTGGTRDGAFDAAMLRAIQAASDSSLLAPAIAPAVVLDGDSLRCNSSSRRISSPFLRDSSRIRETLREARHS